jgi:hypothetical protein
LIYNDITKNNDIDNDIDEWYKKVYDMIIYLNENLNYNLRTLKKIILEHILEELLFNDIVELLNYLETIEPTNLTKIEKKINKYYKNMYLINKNVTGIILQDNNKQKLIIKNTDYIPSRWVLAQQEDYNDLNSELVKITKQYFPADSKFNKIVGFMSTFKNNYMIFKVKNLYSKNNKGARCDQTNKQTVIKLINEINDEELFNKNNSFTKIELCIIQELILRYLNKVDNLIYYVNPYHSALINIANITFTM